MHRATSASIQKVSVETERLRFDELYRSAGYADVVGLRYLHARMLEHFIDALRTALVRSSNEPIRHSATTPKN